ncbi:MAG: hypothetical protein JSC189_000313 [Candidatus Tokpelaia sp. JSC189]|nr:MAG: hypothetical protein JSC189_000313 [Candidatus Tokpelaia sp. JSC189]
MIGTYANYRNLVNNMTKTLNSLMKQPQVERETAYYAHNIMNVSSVDAFLKDDRLYSYAMHAWGLKDMTYAKGFMRKVLTDHEFAGGLIDKRYQAFAEAFNFVKHGSKATQRDSATRGTVNKYMQQTLEVQSGESNGGIRLALYFNRTVSEMVRAGSLSEKNWPYQMISDKALREVVFTALGIPENIAASDIEAQKKMIESRMLRQDLTDLDRLEKFIARFSAMYDVEKRPQVSPALSLLQGSRVGVFGLSEDTLIAMQSLKFGA